ncbi:ABC transporter ATP-binding protein [Pigmentiphaga litoralis]|uniref:Branched-chain amino acid transport system ATP-binding protein n=1 Tax=Pigmentiphaga litoralis TaxID=516702 RepID=A0A7Y9IWR4_9BURK|nr:ABC transporter ATP-binding protein [Pigmentiphaga litoralis]NYE21870.1 branched-chain amino acid transport system ATP-binding protein [Pigmentiphaga litoralis]NYE84515.1 branched-chain amino acid transport system ATP-binding protein [Pigmentiphaga litoralis]
MSRPDHAVSPLIVQDLHAWYGASHVLQGVNLTVQPGQIVALLGRNGAGRSTTARALMGMVRARGKMQWRGEQWLGRRTFDIARAGIGYVPESRDVFPTLTVLQNLALGVRRGGPPSAWTMSDTWTQFPQLERRAHTPAHALSGGEQQMLSLSRTLMGDPALVIIDEPTEGLAPMLVEQVARCLEALRDRGRSVLLIEQRLDIALQISSRLYVLGHGKIVFEGSPDTLRLDAAVRRDWIEL